MSLGMCIQDIALYQPAPNIGLIMEEADIVFARDIVILRVKICHIQSWMQFLTNGVMMSYRLNDSDAEMREILSSVKTIALIGASPNTERPSYHVMEFLLLKGFRVLPVNPGQAGKQILGQTVYAKLDDIGEPIDMVEVFRASDAVAGIVDEILKLQSLPKVLWTQLNVVDVEAGKRAQKGGLKVVMNRCPAIEYPRLLG